MWSAVSLWKLMIQTNCLLSLKLFSLDSPHVWQFLIRLSLNHKFSFEAFIFVPFLKYVYSSLDMFMCVCESLRHVQLSVTPWTVALQARIVEWVAVSSSRGSSWPMDWTHVSCIASRFFTIWATREAWLCFKFLSN